jgi:hypothetical protein
MTTLSTSCSLDFSKNLGIVTPVENENKEEKSISKDQIEQSRQRLVKLEEDGLEFVSVNSPWIIDRTNVFLGLGH